MFIQQKNNKTDSLESNITRCKIGFCWLFVVQFANRVTGPSFYEYTKMKGIYSFLFQKLSYPHLTIVLTKSATFIFQFPAHVALISLIANLLLTRRGDQGKSLWRVKNWKFQLRILYWMTPKWESDKARMQPGEDGFLINRSTTLHQRGTSKGRLERWAGGGREASYDKWFCYI